MFESCLIDLHLHLDGSLSPRIARALADMQGIKIPEDEKALESLLTVSENCRDLNEYLEKFAFPCSLLQTPASLEMAVEMLEKELSDEGLQYAEIRFAPQKHTEKGMTQTDAVEAALKGRGKHRVNTNFILCLMRGEDNRAENFETVEVAAAFLGKGVVALDLAGAEALYKTACFKEYFVRAREKGIPFTIHAGEADGPGSIRDALSFGASRIGHGVRAYEDPSLMKLLVEKHIPLELCPSSNLQTALFPDISRYPLPAFLSSGIPVTVNTDNRAVSGTTVARELSLLKNAFSLSGEDVRQLLENAARASFAAEEDKVCMIENIRKQTK